MRSAWYTERLYKDPILFTKIVTGTFEGWDQHDRLGDYMMILYF